MNPRDTPSPLCASEADCPKRVYRGCYRQHADIFVFVSITLTLFVTIPSRAQRLGRKSLALVKYSDLTCTVVKAENVVFVVMGISR